jgi:hypothetical protein
MRKRPGAPRAAAARGALLAIALEHGRNDATRDSRLTIHVPASLDGFIARKDGRVDWLETADDFTG